MTSPGRRPAAVETPYVERKVLEESLHEALLAGRSACVVGAAGTGKSRLAEAALAEKTSTTVSAAGARHPSARAVLQGLVSARADAPRNLLRMLAGRGAEATRGEEEVAVLRAAADFLGREPDHVLVVEDAEALDEEETALLARCVHHSSTPWVVVSRVARPSWDLPEVEVGTLADDEATALVIALIPGAPPSVVAAVVRRADGHPLSLEQCALLLAGTRAAQEPAEAEARLAQAPQSMRGFIGLRLSTLPASERAVVDVAAVLGDGGETDLLRHLAPAEGNAVDAALAQLGIRNLLRVVDEEQDVPRLRFQHAMVREVAYEALAPRRRIEIHRAAAEWYAILPVSQVLESQAHHLERAARLGTPDCDLVRRTVEAMVLFARSVEEERTRVARDVLLRARELADAHPQCAVDYLQLELASAATSFVLGDPEEVVAGASRALQLAQSRADLRAAAEAHLLWARARRYTDDHDVLDRLDRAQAVFHALDDLAGEARVELERAWVAQFRTGIAQQVVIMERAYQLAMRGADTRLQAGMAQDLAMHHAFASGRGAFQGWAVRAGDNSRSDDVGLLPKLALARGTLAMFDADPAAGLEDSGEALKAGRELGLHLVHYNAVVVHLDHLLRSGALAAARGLLPEGRDLAAHRTTAWLGLQLDLLEAQLLQREGRTEAAAHLLDAVAAHELAEKAVLQRDLAEARGWVALDRGNFAEARAHAARALAVDQETGERCAPMRPRLIDLVGAVAAGQTVPLGDVAALRQQGRETGLMTVVGLASRWMYVEELSQGWTVDLYGLQELDVIEAHALDLEIKALSTRDFALLADAAAVWARLGTTVWQARALSWHSELTGTEHPEARELLDVLRAPDGLEEALRLQVRGLRQ